MRSHHLKFALAAAVCCVAIIIPSYPHTAYASPPCDSTYAANHPRLFFTPADIPGLQASVIDGGYDDDAFDWLRYLADDFFPVVSMPTKMREDFGRWAVMSLGTAAHLTSPVDTASILTAREVVVRVMDDYDVDFDEASSAFRLQTLAFGYDMMFDACDDSLRVAVRDEMVAYLQTMTYHQAYQVFALRPYLANHSAMVAGALGVAAICLQDEADPVLLQDAIDFADTIVDNLLTHQLDPGGSYKEGVNYIGWTMRHLIYYFHARKAFDGFDYAEDARIRKIEEWLPYEILPEGYGYLNNLNDSMSHNYPLSRHTTYMDWAQAAWGSGLMAYLFDHTAGQYGINGGVDADKVATVLWNKTLAPTQPGDVLPPAKLWADRGLYYYRTGWPTGNVSDDVVFSFYSGKFHGGHAQEDQNQFTLYGYGSRFVVDHGAGGTAGESEAHNIVLIDGQGQHGTGASIGTDGRISAFVLNDFGDYVQGDATSAYATHSEFNDPDQPLPGTNWSWGYEPGNPVIMARRDVVAIHQAETPPYFIIADDIDKDGTVHTYKWRLHTDAAHTIDVTGDPIRVLDGGSQLEIFSLGAPLGDLSASVSAYDNGSLEPDSDVLNLAVNAANPHFAFLLVPSNESVATPTVAQSHHEWGSVAALDWGGGTIDYVVHNFSGASIHADIAVTSRRRSRHDFEDRGETAGQSAATIETDARLLVIRQIGDVTSRYLATDATSVIFGNRALVSLAGTRANVTSNGTTIDLDRDGLAFLLYGPGVSEMRAAGQPVAFATSAGYVLPATAAQVAESAATPRLLRVRAFPNPFRHRVQVTIELDHSSPARALVYDVSGRRVATLFEGPLHAGANVVVWNGLRDDGKPAAAGVYFARVHAGAQNVSIKISLIR